MVSTLLEVDRYLMQVKLSTGLTQGHYQRKAATRDRSGVKAGWLFYVLSAQ
jgi:hypothetical protein